MTDPLLGALFGNNGPKVEAALDLLTQLNAPAGSGPFSSRDFKISGGQGLSLLGQPLQVSAAAQLVANLGATGQTATSVFQDADSWTLPANRCLGTLALDGTLGVAGQGSTTAQSVSLAFTLNAAAELHYRHLLAVDAASTRLAAFTALVGGSRLPPLVSFPELKDGEVHQLNALCSLALGATASAGKDLTLEKDLFPGLAPAVQVDFHFSVQASVNASLYEQLRWTAGRGAAFTVNPGWVRLRIEREHQRQLTLGALFALDVTYNFGSVLEALLNRFLELNPVKRAMAALADIEAENALLASGNWDAVKGQIDSAIAGRIAEFLDPILADSAAVKKIVAVSGQVVDAYNGLGETLQSFWDGLLNRGDLGAQRQKLRALLTQVKNLPDDPTTLLSPDAQQLIPLIEALSGFSFEEIWLDSGASSRLGQVKQLAAKALSFLDAVENLPDTVLARLQDFAKRTGIAGTVAWLEANATSVDALTKAANARIEKLVAKLLGKAFDSIDPADLAKIQAWAQKLAPILAAPGQFEQQLRAQLQKLDGTVGFKLGLEVDRVSRSTSLLDLEFDPTDKDTVKAVSGISSLANVLKALPEPEGNQPGGPPDPLPYLLRECTFTSQHMRTSSRSFFFSLLGTTSNSRQRLTELAVDVRQAGSALTRSATYSGVFTRTTQVPLSTSLAIRFAASAGWTATAEGPGANLDAPYTSVDHKLRLTVTRDADATTAAELDGIGGLLADLGFVVTTPPNPAAAGHATRLAVSLELGAAALQAFLGNGSFDGAWTFDLLNAAHRWFDEPLTPATANEFDQPDLTRNALLAGLTAEARFQSAWTTTPPAFENQFNGQPFTVHLPSGNVDVVLVRSGAPGGPVTWGNFNMVRDLIARRKQAQGPLAAAAQAFGPAQANPGQATLSRLGTAFASAADAVTPGFWNDPAFAVWLALARVARSAPASLAQATGLTSLRFQDASGTWSPPQYWALDPARLPRRGTGAGVFPLG